MPDADLEAVLSTVKDSHLRDTLSFGIGMHHAGLHERDRKVRSVQCQRLLTVSSAQILECFDVGLVLFFV